MNLNNNDLEFYINSDPTLKLLIRDAKFDYDNLDFQVKLRCSAILIAINRLIDARY